MLSMQELPENIPGIEMEATLKRLGNNKKLLLMVLQQFTIEFDGWVEHFRSVLAGGDFDECRKVAHKLKGAAANIGATQVQQSALALEAASREQSADVPELFKRVEGEINQLLAVLLGEESEMLAADVSTSPQLTREQFAAIFSALQESRRVKPDLLDNLVLSLERAGEKDMAIQMRERVMSFNFKAALEILSQVESRLFGR